VCNFFNFHALTPGKLAIAILNGLHLMSERPRQLVAEVCDDHACGCPDCHH